METRSAFPAGDGASTCPFLAESPRSGKCLCLALQGQVPTVPTDYVEQYCTAARHQECSLFLHSGLNRAMQAGENLAGATISHAPRAGGDQSDELRGLPWEAPGGTIASDGRSRPTEVTTQAYVLVILSVILTCVLAYFALRHQSSNRRSGGLAVAARTGGIPSSARSWDFAPLSRPAEDAILIVSNTSRVTADVRLGLVAKHTVYGKPVRISRMSGTAIDLSSWQAGAIRAGLAVEASAPIVPMRLAIEKGGAVVTDYGVPTRTPHAARDR